MTNTTGNVVISTTQINRTTGIQNQSDLSEIPNLLSSASDESPILNKND